MQVLCRRNVTNGQASSWSVLTVAWMAATCHDIQMSPAAQFTLSSEEVAS